MKILTWTKHSKFKMRQHGLSESRVKRAINHPKRVEEGIASKTVALMQPAGTAKHPYEVWVMLHDTAKKRNVVSAWRYPGKTKPGEPLPPEILREFQSIPRF